MHSGYPRVFVCATLLMLSFWSTAAPLTYNEGVNGDLNDQTLNFDIGINTVTGTWMLEYPGARDYDPFFFSLPGNSVLTDISYVFDSSGVSLPENWVLLPTYVLADSSPARLSSLQLQVPGSSSPQSPFVTSLPLENGLYHIVQYGAFGAFGSLPIEAGDGGSVPYAWTFTVEAAPEVPVPAAVWLFGSALIALAGMAGRKK